MTRAVRNGLLAATAWTALLAVSLALYVHHEREKTIGLAVNEARTNIAKDLAFRRWAASHGGVYIEPDARTPPNPWLARLPNRDVVTTTGKKLTLMNPAYVMRQVMEDYSSHNLAKGHITALQLLNPGNVPDAWEDKALRAMQSGAAEVTGVADIDGKPYLRMIQPLQMEASCLECHAWTGIPVGGLRGGISTAIPLSTYEAIAAGEMRTVAWSHGALWLFGIAGIAGIARRAKLNTEERLRHQVELFESRESLRRLLDATADGIYGLDETGRCTMINRAALRMLGYRDAGELIGRPLHELIHHTRPDGTPYSWADCPALQALTDGKPRAGSGLFWRADGTSFPVEISANPILHDGTVCGSVMSFTDVSERHQAEARLNLAAMVFQSAAEGIVITAPDTTILSVNKAFANMSGYAADEIVGRKTSFRQSGRHDKAFYRDMWDALDTHGRWQGEIWNATKSGDIHPEWVTINVVRDAGGNIANYLGFVSDMRALHDARRQLEYQATHDSLTGLSNRELFRERLRGALARATRHESKLAVMFIDLDNFKDVNDSLGHEAGDDLLRQTTRRLTERLRPEDVLSRWGGDEFILLLEGPNCIEAASLSRRLLECTALPYNLKHNEVFVSASIGISIFPDDAKDISQLLQNADTAMYRAKELGKNSYQFFEAEMNQRAMQRLSLESGMRRGLERNEFLLYYQPQVNILDGSIAGLEALIRWRHPEQGLVSPAVFIPIAEDTGLIGPLSEWVVNEACRQIRAWLGAGLAPPRVAVNFSPRQFRRGDVPTMIGAVLAKHGIDPALLMIELTENALMNDRELGVEILTRLKRTGISLSIDDFGTGYSSLGYLKRFPIDEIKIDKQFVDGLPHDQNDSAIANAVMGISHSMGLKVVAEGVENIEQLGFLQQAGCHLAQGYYFSRPLPPEDILRILEQRRFSL